MCDTHFTLYSSHASNTIHEFDVVYFGDMRISER